MTDTKKCDHFLVKIRRPADGKSIVLSGRPCDVYILLTALELLDPVDDLEFRLIESTSRIFIIVDGYDTHWVSVDVGIKFRRRYTLRSPHKPLSRPVWDAKMWHREHNTRNWNPGLARSVRGLVARLEGAGHEFA